MSNPNVIHEPSPIQRKTASVRHGRKPNVVWREESKRGKALPREEQQRRIFQQLATDNENKRRRVLEDAKRAMATLSVGDAQGFLDSLPETRRHLHVFAEELTSRRPEILNRYRCSQTVRDRYTFDTPEAETELCTTNHRTPESQAKCPGRHDQEGDDNDGS